MLFEAMRQAKGFSVQNELTLKLQLRLAVRKGELTAARWDKFELEGVYNRHDDFDERRRALEAWGQLLLLKLERRGPHPKKPAPAHQRAPLAQAA